MRLQDLIASEKSRQNLTLNELVERSMTAGHPVSRKTWHRWINEDPHSFPAPESIIGMARALRISEQSILDAAAESVGVRAQRTQVDQSIRAITSMIQDRDADEQQLVARFVRSLVRTFDEDGRSDAAD